MVAILVLIFNSICLKSFSKQMFTSPPISMMRSIELTCQRQNTINCLLHPEGRDWPTKTLEDTRSVGLQWELVWTYFQRQINQQKICSLKNSYPLHLYSPEITSPQNLLCNLPKKITSKKICDAVAVLAMQRT